MKRLSRPLERLSELNERAQDLIARTYMAIAPLVPSSVRPIGWRSWAVIRHFVEDALAFQRQMTDALLQRKMTKLQNMSGEH
jgi:hypothetical protein